MNARKRHEFFARLKATIPEPTTELEYGSVFELLIAVILSAQATDKSVNQVTEELFKVANTPEAICRLGQRGLTGYIRSIGLYNSKAKSILATSRILLDKYNGQVPNNRTQLESLPGVGRKTANVVLNTAFGRPTIAVDTHIFRVANRTRLAPGKSVLEVERALERRVPEEFKYNAHHWLILHGRYTCKARKPNCGQCVIFDLCEYRAKNQYE